MPEHLPSTGFHPDRASVHETGEAPTVPLAPGSLPRTASPDVLPQIPGYEILEVLARGGMGIVYKARQVRANRVVALKMILLGGHAGPGERDRFRIDAEALARLQHPGVVQIHEVGEHDGLPFFSMEFCSAGSLADHLDGTPLPASEAAWLIATLAHAVHCCHQHHIIHRDLKPANVLLQLQTAAERGYALTRMTQEDKHNATLRILHSAHPKITDFGLAKNLNVSGHTASNAILGTPSYMAPEQASSRHQELGPPTDVYALGAILYECLTGRPPFKAATTLDTLLQVVQDDPVPPCQLQPRIPADLERICLKCLEKDTHKRYATAEDLAADLERFSRGEPVTARPLGRLARSWRWIKRNPAVVTWMGAMMATLTLGTVTASLLYLEAERRASALDIAVRETREKAKQERVARNEALEAREQVRRALRLADERLLRSQWLGYAGQIALAQREWDAGNAGPAWSCLESCPRGFRGWEHRYLTTLFTRDQQTLSHHLDRVTCVAWSPDGEWLASGSADKTVRVWNVRTLSERDTPKVHPGVVSCLAFSPNGKQLACGAGQVVKLWTLSTGSHVLLAGHNDKITSVAFRPDGDRLATGSADQSVRVWNAETGTQEHTLELHTSAVTAVSFSQKGNLLASSSRDGTVHIWDANRFELLNSIKGSGIPAACLAFSPDGKRLATGSGRVLRISDPATGQPLLLPVTADSHAIASLAFSPNGKQILSTGREPIVKVWDADTGELIHALKGHSQGITGGAFHPAAPRIATSSADRTVKLWTIAQGAGDRTLEAHKTCTKSLDFSPDGTRLVTAGGDGGIKLWKVGANQGPQVLPGHATEVRSIAFSPKGELIASGGLDLTVRLWDSRTGRLRFALREHTEPITAVQFSPDGKRLASVSTDKTIKLWNTETGKLVVSFKGHRDAITGVAFSPDGGFLATSSLDGFVKLWDATTQRLLLSYTVRDEQVNCVVFARDGRSLISGGMDNMVRIHRIDLGRTANGEVGAEMLLVLKGHTAPVTSLSVSHDGKQLASGSEDRTLRVWNLVTGLEVLTLRGHIDEVACVAFSPDRQHLASACEDGTVKLWFASNLVKKPDPVLPLHRDSRTRPLRSYMSSE